MKPELPKLYRVVYVPVWFEQPRLIMGEYDPYISKEYFKARIAINKNGEREWFFAEPVPTEEECKCYMDWDFKEWHYKHPNPIKGIWTTRARPSIKEQNEHADWCISIGLPV